MASFCGFCGAKAIDDRSTFCADCGGKLESSVEEHAPVSHTLPLPALTQAPEGNVVLSHSLTNLISQESSIGKEISPIPAALLAESPLQDPRLLGDTLQEVSVAQVSPKPPTATLPGFLSPTAVPKEDALPPDTVAPVQKIARVLTPKEPAEAIDRDTREESPRAARDEPVEAKSGHVPKEGAPNILLSNSLEEIVLQERKEKDSANKPKSIVAELAEMKALPKLPTKLELPPKSVLLSEPGSIISEGFAERLAKEPSANFFSLREASRALRSVWVQALLALFLGSYLLLLAAGLGFLRYAQNASAGFLLCLFLFRLIAEERQPLWRFLFFFVGSLLLGAALLGAGDFSDRSLALVGPTLGTALGAAAIFVGWFLHPRCRTMSQPTDAVLIGLFSGAAVGALLSTGAKALPQGLAMLFVEALCGGLMGYGLGLAAFRPSERRSLLLLSLSASWALRLLFGFLVSSISGRLSALVGLVFVLALAAGYVVLFGYVIKLKQLERN